MPRLESIAKGGYYPTPQEVTKLIAGRLAGEAGPGEVIRCLDPCCGTGKAMYEAVENLQTSTQLFGIELNEERADQAGEYLDEAMCADSLGEAAASNEAFGLLYLNPPYDHHPEKGRMEHAFLLHCTRYLKEDGVLVYIVPQNQLEISANFLSRNYRDLECQSFPDPEFESFSQIVLFGRKKKNPTPNKAAYVQVVQWEKKRPDPMSHSPTPEQGTYRVPSTPQGPVLFTNRKIDPRRAVAEARKSGLWKRAAIQESLHPVSIQGPRPLMPLRQGHIATLIAAGLLDNFVLESKEDQSRIIVKGTCHKERVIVEQTVEKTVARDILVTEITTLNLANGEINSIRTDARETAK